MFKSLLAQLKSSLRAANRRRLRRRREGRRAVYADWVKRHDTPDETMRAAITARVNRLATRPRISVLMPTYAPNPAFFEAAVASVRAQWYEDWELCIADDASPTPWLAERLADLQREEPRIRVVRRERNGHICEATNSALGLATGDWVTLLDHDDLLPPQALAVLAETIVQFPCAGLIYSDEDKLGPEGERENPYFKPDWNHDLCLGQNLVCHLMAMPTARLRALGGLRPGFEGAQDHDLALRAAEGLAAGAIIHIPHVLYHWRMHADSTAGGAEVKPYASEAGRRAVADHLQRCGRAARVEAIGPGRYRVHWPEPASWPRVSVLIPSRNQARLLRQCLESFTQLTDYPDYELLVIDNGSDEADALALLAKWEKHPQVRVLRDPSPFNYAALNNRAAREATGTLLCLLNNDIEVTEPGWLREMVCQALRPGVGAVGAKLLYPDGTVQHGGIVLGIDRGDGFGGVAALAHKGLKATAGGYGGRARLAQSYGAVTAACLVIQRTHFEAVNGLDEDHLAVAYNDVDFCLRLGELGLTNIWTPFAMLVHHESVSRGRDLAPERRDRFLKERAYMIARWPTQLARDAAYNPNLSIEQADFALAEPPRVDSRTPWFAAMTREH